jgi:EAL domain-containing protein (putative c-di-GMP-specific phosphodiesterase class I)
MKKSYVRRKKYKQGAIIFNEGDIRDNAYILESGSVDIIRHYNTDREKIYATLRQSDLFGEMALMEPGLRSATAIASEDCICYVISADILEDRLQGLDPVVTSLFSRLIEQYRFSRIENSSDYEEEYPGRPLGHMGKAFHSPTNLTDFASRKSDALKELAMEQEIRKALDRNQFQPYLQPIVALKDGSIKGFETLIRWHHPEKGLIMPDEFIPIAERTHLVQAIDRKMLEMVCALIPDIHAAVSGANKPFISVNLSGVNFDDDSMVSGITEVLKSAAIDPKYIKLEITEGAFIGNADQAALILEKLKELGLSIALDDFGVGYSSLGYLHKFAIDGIKIDRSFTKRARDNKKSMNMVQAIVGLAKTFDLEVIAEGIEDQFDVDSLMKIGCLDGQGYLFGKPMTVEDAIKKLH